MFLLFRIVATMTLAINSIIKKKDKNMKKIIILSVSTEYILNYLLKTKGA